MITWKHEGQLQHRSRSKNQLPTWTDDSDEIRPAMMGMTMMMAMGFREKSMNRT